MPDQINVTRLGPLAIKDLPGAVEEIIQQGKGFSVWLLKGEMGAGKTTLVKHLIDHLGIAATVSSPTFSIVNQYGTEPGPVVYHFDLYRLKNESEAFDIGLEEYLDSGNLCLIEWPDKLQQLLPNRFFEIVIKEDSPHTRTIDYCRHD